MIDRILVKKYIGQSALLWSALAMALFAFAWVRLWVVGQLDTSQFTAFLDMIKDWEKYFPVELTALATYSGKVAMTFDEPIVILCTVIWAVARGSDVVSGELSRGTLEMLLSQPISRAKLMLSHALVSIVGLGLLCFALWAGLAVGIQLSTVKETQPTPKIRIPIVNLDVPISSGDPVVDIVPMRELVDVTWFASPIFHLFAFGFFVLALSTFFSSWDRYRWRTIGAVMTVYILELVLFGLGKAAESMSWLQGLSFFSCYKPQMMTALVREGGVAAPWSLSEVVPNATFPPLVYPLILIGSGVLLYGIAIWRFRTRDLPAPL